MRSALPLFALLLPLAGCGASDLELTASRATGTNYDDSAIPPLAPDGGDGQPGPLGDDDDSVPADPAFALDLVSIDPPPDSTDHHYRRPIVLSFNGYAAGVQLRVTNEAGESLATHDEWNDDFTQLRALPYELHDGSSHLRPSQTYDVSVEIGNSSLSWSFTTSAVGQAVDDPGGLSGSTYAVSFAGARSWEQPGLAELLASFSGPTWLWEVQVDGANVELAAGVAVGDSSDALSQDLCTPLASVGGASAGVELVDNPYFASPPGDFELWVDGEALRFEDGWIDGDFTPDGAGLAEVGFRGWLREDSLSPLFGPGACDLLASDAGLGCEACPSGDGLCAWIDLGGISGAQTAWALEDGDGACPDGAPAAVFGCSAAGRGAVGWLLLPVAVLLRRRRR